MFQIEFLRHTTEIMLQLVIRHAQVGNSQQGEFMWAYFLRFFSTGLVLQERLNEMGATLPVIFITGHGDVNMAVEALKSGAVDFIQKPYHDQNLLDSINDALELDNRNRNVSQHEEAMGKCIEKLTKREHQVMDLLSQGHTNKMIGKRLDISPRTVEVHRQHILQKCKVKSVTQLMYLLNRPVS